MFIVRPVRMADLAAIEQLAASRGLGLNSLPANREKLFERIQRSISSFEYEASSDADCEYYMLVLEIAGEVRGTAALCASAGFDLPFYNYRNDILVHASRAIGVNNRVHVLNLCYDLTGMAQLQGFDIDTNLPPIATELLSRARLLFIASQRQRFNHKIIAEVPGQYDDAGHSPFWDAIGRRFFNMDYWQVEQAFVTHSKTFIAELMPTYPVYVPLLPDAAQQAISQTHPASELACQVLFQEGFEADQYIDIFDGGAVFTATIDQLHTLQHSCTCAVNIQPSLPLPAQNLLISNPQIHSFVTALSLGCLQGSTLYLLPDHAHTLNLSQGDQAIVTTPYQEQPQ